MMRFTWSVLLFSISITQIWFPSQGTGMSLKAISDRFGAMHLMETIEEHKNLLKMLKNFSVQDHLFSVIKEVWKTHSTGTGQNPFFHFNECLVDLMNVSVSATRGDLWAIAVVDSFGKVGDGIMQGNTHWAGNYFQCRERPVANALMGRRESANNSYCWTTFTISSEMKVLKDSMQESRNESIKMETVNKFLTLNVAICVPKSCGERYLETLLQTIGDAFAPPDLKKVMRLKSVSCVQDVDIAHDPVGLIGLLICLLFAILMLTSTICDVKKRRATRNKPEQVTNMQALLVSSSSSSSEDEDQSSKQFLNVPRKDVMIKDGSRSSSAKEIFLSFSIYSNLLKIFNMKESEETLTSIHGVRVLSLAWVILGHTFLYAARSTDNPLAIGMHLRRFWLQVVSQGVFAVDSFYVISGLLVAYGYLQIRNKKCGSKFSWTGYYIRRYWRLTPPLLMIMFLFHISLFPYLGSGPFWPKGGFEKNHCRSSWWYNVLYINSWFNSTDVCFDITWFVANDFQFYAIAPLMLLPLMYPRFSFISIIVGLVILTASWIVSGVVAVRNNFPAGMNAIFQGNDMQDYKYMIPFFEELYCKPFYRIGAFVIGIFTGWALFKARGHWKLNKFFVAAMWCGTLPLGFAVIFGLYKTHLQVPQSSIYLVMAPTVWAICVAWIIFACSTGNGGLIDSFLSAPFWKPLSRITYCTYLIHSLVIYVVFLGYDKPIHVDTHFMMNVYVGLVAISYSAGLMLSLAFEAPFMAIERNIAQIFQLRHRSRLINN